MVALVRARAARAETSLSVPGALVTFPLGEKPEVRESAVADQVSELAVPGRVAWPPAASPAEEGERRRPAWVAAWAPRVVWEPVARPRAFAAA